MIFLLDPDFRRDDAVRILPLAKGELEGVFTACPTSTGSVGQAVAHLG